MKVVVEKVIVRAEVSTRNLERKIVERAIEKIFEAVDGNGKVWIGGRSVELVDVKLENSAVLLFAVKQNELEIFVKLLEKELKKLQDLIDTIKWFKGIKEILEPEPKTLSSLLSNRIDVIV